MYLTFALKTYEDNTMMTAVRTRRICMC